MEKVLTQVNHRCEVGIVMETVAAIHISKQLAQLPIYRIHIGLNDLAKDLNNLHPFLAVADGTVENILKNFNISNNSQLNYANQNNLQSTRQNPMTGFGGLTLPEKGQPIPSHLLMGE